MTYREWVSQVRRNGGIATTLPGDARAAARYPVDVLRTLRLVPVTLTANREYGYVLAPADVQREAGTFGKATPAETQRAGVQLQKQWATNSPWGALGAQLAQLGSVAGWLLTGLLIYGAYRLYKAAQKVGA